MYQPMSYSVFQFPWCEHASHGQFQTADTMALKVKLGVVASGTDASIFHFWHTDPVAANNLKNIDNNKMCNDKKVRSSCSLSKQVNAGVIIAQ